MTAETASDAAPAAPANGEAKKRPNGAPGSPVARGGPRAPKGPVAEPSAKPRGRGRGSAASRKHGHETVDGRPRAPLPGTSKRRTAGNGGARHSGEVVYVCQSYGFIRKDGDSSSEDIFMHLVDVDFEPKLRDRVSFELATFRDRPKAVEVTLESSRGPDDRSVRLQSEDAAWPKSERGRVADALLKWLQAKGGELALNSDAVTAFFAAHEALSKKVTSAKMAPSLALKRAVREFGTHLGMELKADATGRASAVVRLTGLEAGSVVAARPGLRLHRRPVLRGPRV